MVLKLCWLFAQANILATWRKWRTKILGGHRGPVRPFYSIIRCQVGESLDGPRWCTKLYADDIEAASRLHRGRPRWASMGVASGTNLYAGGIEAASRLHRGRPRWASMGPTTSSWSLQRSQSWTRTCLSQRGAGWCFGIGQLFIAPGLVLIAGWKDLGDLVQVAD